MAIAVYADIWHSHCKYWSTVSKKHGNQFLCQHFKILSVWCLTNWEQSLRTKKTQFYTKSGGVDMDSDLSWR